MSERILVIEDDRSIQKLLQMNLQQEGYEVLPSFTGDDGLRTALAERPDLVILDINLPGMKGTDVCKRMKSDQAAADIPVIILTVKTDEIDRVLGFEIGADDYVTKPFSVRELMLRVAAVLGRRSGKKTPARLRAGDIVLDESTFEVTVRNVPLNLTAMEFKLLKHFMRNKERLFSRTMLLNAIWGYDAPIDTRTVDAHIKSLRRKLSAKKVKIVTVIGMGYKLSEHV